MHCYLGQKMGQQRWELFKYPSQTKIGFLYDPTTPVQITNKHHCKHAGKS